MSHSILPEAKYVVEPPGIVSTEYPAVEATSREIGVSYDQWQAGLNRLLLAKRSDGLYAADMACVSSCRQVGKTWDVGRVVFALCIKYPGLTVVWTAHRTKTAYKTFQGQRKLAMSPKLAGHIDQRPGKGIKTGGGDRSITFLNDSSIEMAAREKSVLGWADVDVLVVDESQLLTESALTDMVPTTNASPNPIIIFLGNPPRPENGDRGDVWRRLRREALSGESDDVLWVELGADPDADPDDDAAIRQANPAFPRRTSVRAINRMRKLLTFDNQKRDVLGVWDEDRDDIGDAKRIVDLDQWDGLEDLAAAEPETATIWIDVAPDRAWSSIGIAADWAGRTLVMVKRAAGTAWVVKDVVDLRDRKEILEVAVNPHSQAGALISDLEAEGVEVERVNSVDQGAACAAFLQGIIDARYWHVGQAEIRAALDNLKTRMVGEVETWDRREWIIDISSAVAVAGAAHRWIKIREDDYDVLDSVG